MLNLAEYRRRSDRLSDHLPWACLVAPGIVLNKDGSLQRSFRFRGPDLESATEAELISACARANNVLRRFGSGWAIFFEADRREALAYPEGIFPDAASWLVDQERREAFLAEGQHFESRYHGTLLWLPPADQSDALGRNLIEKDGQSGRDWRQALAGFAAETDRVFDLFAAFMPELAPLDDQETLTYLHGTISERAHPVRVPSTPAYLDAILADTALVGGLEPMLGKLHIRALTLRAFPNLSRPGLLDALNNQGFAYRWMTRFIALDKVDATKALTRIRRQWFSKRKSLTALLREVMYNQPTQLLDTDADNKVVDVDLALQALGGDHVAFGYMTTTIVVADADSAKVEEKVRAVERVVNGLGFTCIRESVNAVEAWLSSLPGQVYANVRQPLIHSLNLAHMMPLSAIWAGPADNGHLAGPPLLQAQTQGATPFRLSTHVEDVGHVMVVGPTGAGKSVLLALIAMQFRRYPGARLIFFDMGLSARATILSMGGSHHCLGAGEGDMSELSFQPLRGIDDEKERGWAAGWIAGLFAQEKLLITPEVNEAVWSALSTLATAPPEQRTLTGLSLMLQSNTLRSALAPYLLEGARGGLLDAAREELDEADVQCFETEALMGQKAISASVLTYLFHRIEARFDGRPTLLILDEAWRLLDDPMFAGHIREWLKTLRKKNVAVIFATQSLADISGSTIAPAIIESCPQRIFLPNATAAEPQSRETYARFGLNSRQIELISRSTPKKHYYLQSRRGNRLFELGLGPIARALCGASDQAAQERIRAIMATHGRTDFAAHFLRSAGFAQAQAMLGQFPRSDIMEK
ncbi:MULTISPECIES: conjugal transfer protein TrbE [Sphingobium]|jgi:type IV secretion/conjugal transfer VirB4 family ATPase|uniref:conjugal transfer protein TrbE n=1 Tax=Sphingobium TaxID=165695 RepID=UPI0010CA827D|nr:MULTISPECIES: conjugal transfer protein TrbE [Sphingobium]TKV42722.1 conjugal transfer protein TrbE [Sphingobium sp. MP9-4]